IAFDDLGASSDASDASLPEPTQGLIASWHFDEGTGTSAADVSGNGHDATLFSGARGGAAKRGTALALDGVAAFAAATQSSLFDRAMQPWTIAAWVWDDT